jgi:hypothetical protein
MTFYVRMGTRGSAKKGTPRQALNYITDGHDARRDSSYSDAEVRYIARMDPGWKADLEGGRVPLAGFGALASEVDQKKLAESFERACVSDHDLRATTGYKSITLTLPKEVSLYAEGHREEAKAAINAAVKNALDRAFSGFRYSAVGAIHTRNQVGEVHYHVHVLVAKFAKQVGTERTYSLSSPAGGNTGRGRLKEMKVGWQEGIEKEFRERLGLGIEQKTSRSPVSLVMPDGEHLEPLNRDSRRVLEKELCPQYTETTPQGHAVIRHFRWSAMDDRIFEIASGSRGESGWSLAAFKEHFPELAKYSARYEARVRTLQYIGYLTPDLKIDSPFRVHFAAHHGVLTPELQRVRIDLAKHAAKTAPHAAPLLRPEQFWAQVARCEGMQRRIERLGYTREQVNDILTRAAAHKPTRENLNLIRANAERRAANLAPPRELPTTKTIIRAFIDLQKAEVYRIYLLSSGILQFWKFAEKRDLAARIKKAAERDLFYAKEKRLAQVGRALRPVLWLVRVPMPREVHRLEQAMTRCSRLAQLQQIRRAGREEIQRAYEQWRRDFVQRPLAQLKKESQKLALPAQAAERKRLEGVRQKITTPDIAKATALFRQGYEAFTALSDKGDSTHQVLKKWIGKEEDLVARVYGQAKGEPSSLTAEEYKAAVRVGRIGHALHTARTAPALEVPDAFVSEKAELERLSARIHGLGLRSPITPDNLASLSPNQVSDQLQAARKAGLLDDGPGWTLQGQAARSFVQDLGREIEQSRETEQSLEDQLIKRRFQP